MDEQTNPASPTGDRIQPDDPRVQARIAEKRASAAREAEQLARKAFAAPEQIGPFTFYPPNSQTFDAICQPDYMRLSQPRFILVLAYLLTLRPSTQIAAAADVVALRNAAAVWQDSVDPALWPQIHEVALRANQWLQARLAGESAAFFFATQTPSPSASE